MSSEGSKSHQNKSTTHPCCHDVTCELTSQQTSQPCRDEISLPILVSARIHSTELQWRSRDLSCCLYPTTWVVAPAFCLSPFRTRQLGSWKKFLCPRGCHKESLRSRCLTHSSSL